MANTFVFFEGLVVGDSVTRKLFTVITNGRFEETNEFRIPGSEAIVKLRPISNTARGHNAFMAEMILVEPANDIISVSGEICGSFSGVVRSKGSLIISGSYSDFKFNVKSHKVFSFKLNNSDHPWKKSFLNLTPANPPDVTVRADGKDIPTTIAIMSAKSDVFTAMFTHDTKEKRTGVVEIEDFSFLVVQEMIRFLMYDYCTHWDGHYENLAAIADKYNIAGMKQQAAQKKKLLDKYT
jgi:hypothetical protein